MINIQVIFIGKYEMKKNLLLSEKHRSTPAISLSHLIKKQLCLPSKLHAHSTLPDILIHYLLLYNLSMIARYETEWWFELMKTTPNTDYPFIKTFLSITEKKGPHLALEFLSERQRRFS